MSDYYDGSSPLARGLRKGCPEDVWTIRIIPARAGFTIREGSTVLPVPGSSPLARGLRPHIEALGNGERIIPARAGFTPDCSRR